jgi:hypothetical protein
MRIPVTKEVSMKQRTSVAAGTSTGFVITYHTDAEAMAN